VSRSSSNLYKSPEGWARFRDRTASGARAHRPKMDHRPLSRIAAEAKGQPRKAIDIPAYEGETVVRRGRKQRRVRIAG
jgi:hypothetical protein